MWRSWSTTTICFFELVLPLLVDVHHHSQGFFFIRVLLPSLFAHCLFYHSSSSQTGFLLWVYCCQNAVPRFTNNFSAIPTVAVPFAFEYGGYSQLVTTLWFWCGATVTSQQCTFCIAEFHASLETFVIWVVPSMVQNAGWALGCHFLWLQDTPECWLGVKLPFSLALLECFWAFVSSRHVTFWAVKYAKGIFSPFQLT